jgi:hypothetical protein
MPFCIRCEPANCGNIEGVISISLSTRGNFKTVDTSDCGKLSGGGGQAGFTPNQVFAGPVGSISPGSNGGSGGGSGSSSKKTIKGPIIGNITLTAYAFNAGQDPWNNIRCEGTIQASQNVIQKQDYFSDSTYLIPEDNASVQFTGDIGSVATIDNVAFSTEERRLQNINGISLGTRLGVDVGSSFKFTGGPISVEMPSKDNFYTVFNFGCCFLVGFNYSVNFPTQPATVSYNFQFIKNGAKNNAGLGNGTNGGINVDNINNSPSIVSAADIFNLNDAGF